VISMPSTSGRAPATPAGRSARLITSASARPP